MLIEFLLFAATAAICFFFLQQHAFSYWKRHNIKILPPRNLVGNFGDLFTTRKNFDSLIADFHSDPSLKPEDKLVGLYNCLRPLLLVRDVQVAKRILIKDFNYFTQRSFQADPYHDPLGNNNIFFAPSNKWRELRPKLSPVFTSGKIKQMYPLMTDVARELETMLQTYKSRTVVNAKEIANRFTNEMIGMLAFGVKAGSLQDINSVFYRHNLSHFAPTLRRAIEFFVALLLPALVPLLRVKIFPPKMAEFMRDTIKHIIEERERSGAKRNDLLDTLITMKQEAAVDPNKANPAKDFDFLVAQAALFQVAGFETSASTMTFTLYELAQNPDVQERLRAEIRDAFEDAGNEGKEISYERLQELPYLSQVVNETLRKYPVAGSLTRDCTPPAGNKGYSLAPDSDFVIPAKMSVYISILGIHRDEHYWPNPDKYDPKRFAPENRKNLNMDAYLPFGAGPRNCLGMRIGLLQTKLGLVHILKDHRVVSCKETPKKIEFASRTVVLASDKEVCVSLERVENSA